MYAPICTPTLTTDEGATNYHGRILQATLGQEWLADRLGVFPSSGWHMDPFGNSAISPLLFQGYGFDSHVVSAIRLPGSRMGTNDAEASTRTTKWHWHQQLQNVWKGAAGAAVFQHIIGTVSLVYCNVASYLLIPYVIPYPTCPMFHRISCLVFHGCGVISCVLYLRGKLR